MSTQHLQQMPLHYDFHMLETVNQKSLGREFLPRPLEAEENHFYQGHDGERRQQQQQELIQRGEWEGELCYRCS